MVSTRAPWAECGACPLYCEPRRKRDPFVPGEGPDQADVVVVGMAPGDTEVTLKRVFIGPSGRLLDALLAKAGLERSQVYVTNAVLCSTHDGKSNQPVPAAAISACRARLFMELKGRKPKVVVALGNDVLRAFGVDEKVSDCRGRERWVGFDDLTAVLLKGQTSLDGLATARALAAYINEASADLVLLGMKAVDDDQQQVGPMLGELLDRPCVTVVASIEIEGSSVVCHREIEGGVEVVEAPLPAILTITKGEWEPRFPNLKGIMAAKKKPLEEKDAQLGTSRIEIQSMTPPRERPAGRIVGNGADAVPELVRVLHEEAKVI